MFSPSVAACYELRARILMPLKNSRSINTFFFYVLPEGTAGMKEAAWRKLEQYTATANPKGK